MSHIVKIEIQTEADPAKLKAVATELQTAIAAAQKAGKPYDDLSRQLTQVQTRMQTLAAANGNASAIMEQSAQKVAGSWEKAGREIVSRIPFIGPQIAALNGAFAPLMTTIGAVGVAAGIAWKSISKFAGAQEAVTALDAALANSGQLTDAFRERLQKLASGLGGQTGKSSTEWVGALGTLVKFGADASNIDKLADSVKNLAGFLGGDLTGAAFLMGKALQGNFTMLGRYGIRVDENADKATKLAQAMRQIEMRGGGQLEAQTKTITGQFRELALATGGFFKGLGNALSQTGLLQTGLWLLTAPLKALNRLLPKTVNQVGWMPNQVRPNPQNLADDTEASGKAMGGATSQADAFAKALERIANNAQDAIANLQKLADVSLEIQLAKIDLRKESGSIDEPEAMRQKARAEYDATMKKIQGERSILAGAGYENSTQLEGQRAVLGVLRENQSDARSRAFKARDVLADYVPTFYSGDLSRGDDDKTIRAKKAKAAQKWATEHKDDRPGAERNEARKILTDFARVNGAESALESANAAVAAAEKQLAESEAAVAKQQESRSRRLGELGGLEEAAQWKLGVGMASADAQAKKAADKTSEEQARQAAARDQLEAEIKLAELRKKGDIRGAEEIEVKARAAEIRKATGYNEEDAQRLAEREYRAKNSQGAVRPDVDRFTRIGLFTGVGAQNPLDAIGKETNDWLKKILEKLPDKQTDNSTQSPIGNY